MFPYFGRECYGVVIGVFYSSPGTPYGIMWRPRDNRVYNSAAFRISVECLSTLSALMVKSSISSETGPL